MIDHPRKACASDRHIAPKIARTSPDSVAVHPFGDRCRILKMIRIEHFIMNDEEGRFVRFAALFEDREIELHVPAQLWRWAIDSSGLDAAGNFSLMPERALRTIEEIASAQIAGDRDIGEGETGRTILTLSACASQPSASAAPSMSDRPAARSAARRDTE